MKTAIQELEDKLKDNLKWIVMNADYELMDKLFSQALEKEKEQIVDAANQKIFGDITFTGSDEIITKGENYYNQTYNQNK